MVTTRSKDSGNNNEELVGGTKRKEHAEPPRQEPEPKTAKKQTTLDETLQPDHGTGPSSESQMDKPERKDEHSGEANGKANGSDQGESNTKQEVGDEKASGDAIEESANREKNLPSNILEKGIIYFFTRNRVGIEDAESVGDLQRTFFVLRPLPPSAKLGDGTLPDTDNNRLFALPKKTFPKSHQDRFMAFVEKSNVSIETLKHEFFKGSEYETQTSGTRHVDPVTPVGEGVYIITRTEDRTTHLAYAVTIPAELGEVQEDLGLRSSGSFIISVKNPERPGPASARLPQAPSFSKEILEEFRGLAWAEVKPKYLDYENCQILLIGENSEKATEQTTKDKKHEKATPQEEIEQLEHEDELRVEHLRGDESIFDDLEISKKDYSKVPTTW